jgi:NAD(P)-dependent dehydrogenase (short-subunit alcohol dehydrogenase family)
VARKFAQTYAVALLARKPENYEPIVDEINKSGGQAVGISTDVADGESVQKAFAQLKGQMGSSKLSAAIYNVGGRFIRKPFLELSASEFESGWEANGYGTGTDGARCR